VIITQVNSPDDVLLVCVSTALRPMNNDLCLSISPNTTQLCHISCPVECEVSSWSAWGPCTFENCQDQAAKKGKEETVDGLVSASSRLWTAAIARPMSRLTSRVARCRSSCAEKQAGLNMNNKRRSLMRQKFTKKTTRSKKGADRASEFRSGRQSRNRQDQENARKTGRREKDNNQQTRFLIIQIRCNSQRDSCREMTNKDLRRTTKGRNDFHE